LFENDPTKYRFTRDEDEFLESIERTTFQFFWNETNPVTGLVKDRSHADGTDQRNVASIAATGFPGSPAKGVAPTCPIATGRPGLIASRQK